MAKILIIGAGVAGLSAGIHARLHGHEAVICEKHFISGGNLTAWDRSGYHIDNCIHWLTGTNPVTKTYQMWEELGALGGIEIFQGDSLFTCEYEGKRLSLFKDVEKMKNANTRTVSYIEIPITFPSIIYIIRLGIEAYAHMSDDMNANAT